MILLAEVTLFELLRQGGWAMYPLGLLSMVLLALVLHAWMQTSRTWTRSSPITRRTTR